MGIAPNVLNRFHEKYQASFDQADLSAEWLMPHSPGVVIDDVDRLLALAMAYAAAWWWATDNDTESIALRLAEKACRDTTVAYRLKVMATHGAPMLRYALHMDDVAADFHAAHNALMHLSDLANALPDKGCAAIAHCMDLLLAIGTSPTICPVALLPATSAA